MLGNWTRKEIDKLCPKCNIKLYQTLTPHSVHYARIDCPKCGFISWARNPDSPRNKGTQKLRIGKKSVQEVCSFHGFIEDFSRDNKDKEFCFFCLRKRDQLGWNETLTVDHIKELDKGGKDVLENMQVLCSACHKLKNWTRLYVNWHLNKEETEDDDTKTTAAI